MSSLDIPESAKMPGLCKASGAATRSSCRWTSVALVNISFIQNLDHPALVFIIVYRAQPHPKMK